MKIILYLIYVMSFVGIIYSCSTNKQKLADFNEASFLSTFHLADGNKYHNDSLFLGNPILLRFHPDSFLLFSDKGNNLVTIIDLKNNKIQKVIKQGKGPGELITAYGVEIQGKDVYIFCPLMGKVVKLKPDPNRKFQIIDEFNLNEKGAIRFYPVKEDLFVCLSKIGDEKRLTFLDKKGRILKKIGDYPSLLNNKMIRGDNNIFQSHIIATPNGNKILLACSTTDILEIYDTDKGLMKRFQGPIGINITVTKKDVGVGIGMHTEPSYSTYCMVCANENEFWTGFVGYKFEKQKRSTILDTSPKRIFCFDWKGNPLRKIEFDNILHGFDVDWKNKILYTIQWLKENPVIVSYSVNSILN